MNVHGSGHGDASAIIARLWDVSLYSESRISPPDKQDSARNYVQGNPSRNMVRLTVSLYLPTSPWNKQNFAMNRATRNENIAYSVLTPWVGVLGLSFLWALLVYFKFPM
jgi:hypothetical protein